MEEYLSFRHLQAGWKLSVCEWSFLVLIVFTVGDEFGVWTSSCQIFVSEAGPFPWEVSTNFLAGKGEKKLEQVYKPGF